MSVYYSLVYSHFLHAIICWGNSSKTIKHKLHVKENRIIKTLRNKFGKKLVQNHFVKKCKSLTSMEFTN